MGHGINTDLAYTIYQVPDRPVDVVSSRYADEGGEFLDIVDLHSSVAWHRMEDNTNNILQETLKDDILLNQAIKAYTSAGEKVFKRFGSRTWSLDESVRYL